MKDIKEVKKLLKSCYPKLIGAYKGSNFKTEFLCYFCKSVFETTPQKVYSKHTQSCGCVSLGRRKGTKNISSTFYSRLLGNASRRKLDINIDIYFLDNLIIKQNFRCALSSLEITAGYGDLRKQTASVDRIDNNKGYLKNNIQFVHKDINWMKQDFNEDYFIELCNKVSNKCIVLEQQLMI